MDHASNFFLIIIMATGFNRLGPQAWTSSPPAIVREARNCAWYEARLSDEASRHTKEYGAILKEFKESGAWKEKYKTWGAACEHAMDISRSYANQLIKEYESDVLAPTAEVAANKTTKKEEASLKQVEKAREVSPTPREEEPEKPRVKTATEVLAENKPNGHTETFKPSLDMGIWAGKVMALLNDMPRSRIHNKLSPENIKVFESSIDSLRLLLVELLPQKPVKEVCKCGCGLSAVVAEKLFKVGVPCKGLTEGQAGLVMAKLAQNEWRLPRAFEFLKNEGEWKERQWLGKPENKAK